VTTGETSRTVEPRRGPGTPRRSARRDAWVAISLFALALFVFWWAPVSYLADGKYTLLLARNLLAGEGWRLDRHFTAPRAGEGVATDLPYQVTALGGHVYLAYPNAGAYLALPWVALLEPLGLSVLDARGAYDAEGERELQRRIAGVLGALLAPVLYLGLRRIAPCGASAAGTLVALLGSVVLSDLTRSLWSQSWAVLLVGLTLLELLVAWHAHRPPRPARLGSLLAWLVLLRPSALLLVLCVFGYLACRERRAWGPTLAWAVAWTLLVAAVNLAVYGTFRQPSIYRVTELIRIDGAWERLGHVLVSPSRGLLVYMPWVTLALAVLLFRRRVAARGVIALCLVAAAAHLALLSCYVRWVGGSCYGPRLWGELVPLLAIAATAGLRAALRDRRPSVRGAVLALALTAVGWSLLVNWRGAFSPATHEWNRRLEGKGWRSPALYDWSQPQFLAGWLDREPDVVPD